MAVKPHGQCTCCTQEDGTWVCGCEPTRCPGCWKCPRHCVCTLLIEQEAAKLAREKARLWHKEARRFGAEATAFRQILSDVLDCPVCDGSGRLYELDPGRDVECQCRAAAVSFLENQRAGQELLETLRQIADLADADEPTSVKQGMLARKWLEPDL